MDFTGLKSYGTSTSTVWERPEQRSLLGGGPATGLSAFLPAPVLSGVAVTPDTALTFTAAFACINVVATDMGALPLLLRLQRPGEGTVDVPGDDRYQLLYCEPNANVPAARFFQALIGHRLGWGNGYSEIDRVKSGRKAGMPGALHLLSPKPSDTYAVRTRGGRLAYKIDGGRRELLAEDVVHHAGLSWDGLTGYSPVALARQAVGLGIAQEQHGAAFYGNSCSPKGAIEVAKKLTPEACRNIRESIEAVHQGTFNAHRLMILEEGMKFNPYSIDPVDAQYLESRKFQVLEVCRIYRVPPHKVGDWSQSHLANVEEANVDYRNTTIGPESTFLRQELSRKLLTRDERARGYRLDHDFVSLLQGDSKARMEYWKERFATGSASPDMIAEAEGDNPLPEGIGQHFYIPMNLQRLGGPESGQARPSEPDQANGLPAEPDPDGEPGDADS
jgi:HK97 family phage portal protein